MIWRTCRKSIGEAACLLAFFASAATPQGATAEGKIKTASADTVVRQILSATGLHKPPIPKIQQRIRLSALLPHISVSANASDSAVANIDPAATQIDLDSVRQYRGYRIEVRASWQLDKLLFRNEELRAVQLFNQLNRDREDLARRVLDIYYRRQRAIAAGTDPYLVDELTTLLRILGAREN